MLFTTLFGRQVKTTLKEISTLGKETIDLLNTSENRQSQSYGLNYQKQERS